VSALRIEAVDRFAADLLAELQAASADEAWGRDFIANLLATPGAMALVANRDLAGRVEPIGFALLRAGGGECEVLSIGVTPTARRQGTGRALLSAAIATATDAGATSLFLEVADDNIAARALYRAAGFQRVGIRKAYYRRLGGSVDALILRLQLSR
jgi:[ribosomal protein S18]-alanine N-acetyltransferase